MGGAYSTEKTTDINDVIDRDDNEPCDDDESRSSLRSAGDESSDDSTSSFIGGNIETPVEASCRKTGRGIDFLEDESSEMTKARRIALKLLQQKWYNPNAHLDDHAIESSRIAIVGEVNHELPSLKRAWAYFEHNTLARYVVADENVDTSKMNIFQKLKFSFGSEEYEYAQPGEIFFELRKWRRLRLLSLRHCILNLSYLSQRTRGKNVSNQIVRLLGNTPQTGKYLYRILYTQSLLILLTKCLTFFVVGRFWNGFWLVLLNPASYLFHSIPCWFNI